MTARPEPGSAELEILRVLWDEGPCTVRQVLEHLRRRSRRPAYTTVQTLLTRLEQKQMVRCDRSGRAHVFRARVSRERIVRRRLHDLARLLYDGSAGPLVLHLVRHERLRPEELEELQRLLDTLEREDGATGRRRGKKP